MMIDDFIVIIRIELFHQRAPSVTWLICFSRYHPKDEKSFIATFGFASVFSVANCFSVLTIGKQ